MSVCVSGRLNLGKKICVPQDIMTEELQLPSNRGSRMFQERMKRAERFTLENAANPPTCYPVLNPVSHIQMPQNTQGGKENVRTEVIVQPRKMLVTTLDKTVAKKGTPNVIAPGYAGPLKEMPMEKFNLTVTPKGYCSPWREALGPSVNSQFTFNLPSPEPPQKQYLTHYRCFNRAPIPFNREAQAPRLVPIPRAEVVEAQGLPIQNSDRAGRQHNFNRAPRGWGINYNPESIEL
ncbi:myozenin-2-like isoform X2 [Conger conger]|uniref:myozenin-2-like isoform X2 n=1 Tax=Conger conger TaxID=82655 RepID=UPI002A5A1314|nr:myozenin-2-like isoform X2 [Conger conger]